MTTQQVLLDNKKEYMDHLYEIAVPALMNEFQDMYDSVSTKSNALQAFQTTLTMLPEWNNIKVSEAYGRFIGRSGCQYFPDLIRGIMVTIIKLSTSGLDNKSKVKIRVPSSENFVHRCIVACARSVWKKPYLFYHNVRSIERQHNMGLIEELFRKAISSTIRSCLPMGQLLKQVADDHSSSTSEEEEESDEDESEEEEESEEEIDVIKQGDDEVEEDDVEEDDDISPPDDYVSESGDEAVVNETVVNETVVNETVDAVDTSPPDDSEDAPPIDVRRVETEPNIPEDELANLTALATAVDDTKKIDIVRRVHKPARHRSAARVTDAFF